MPVIEVSVEQLDSTSSRGMVRDHAIIMDRPEAKGGQNKGPMGGEALLLGLGGCFMSNLLAAARARDVAVSDARVRISGDIAEAPARYQAIHMQVTAQCSPADELEKLVTIAHRGCIVANTLAKAVKLTVACAD